MRWFETQTRAAKILMLLERRTVFEPDKPSTMLGVSTRTIKNEIRHLNESLDGAARITMVKGVYRLFIFDAPRFNTIHDELTKPAFNFESSNNRMAYIADFLFNSEDYVLIDDMAFDINVSRTTLVNDLSRLKKVFKNYGIEIIGKTNTGIKAVGDEFSIRKFIIENIYDLVYSKNEVDSDVWEMFFNTMNQFNLESNTIDMAGRYLVLSLDRFLNGYPVSFKDREYFYDLQNTKLFEIVNNLCSKLSLQLGIDLTDEEKLFIMIPFAGMRTPVNISALENYIDVDQDTISLIDKIISRLHEETDLSFQFDDSLEDFIYHITFLSNRLKYGMYLENPLKEEIKNKFGLAWKLAERTAEIIEEETGKNVNDDEIGFLTSYFEIILQEQHNRARKKFKILLIHHKGGAAMRLIMYQLKNILSSDAKIDSLPYKPGERDYQNGYDLIITTGRMDLNTDTPVIELDEVIDEEFLRQQIERVQYTKGLNLIPKQQTQSVLLSLLSNDKIFSLPDTMDYSEALRLMSDKAVSLGLADEEFLERIKERETKAPMDFSDELAFPHTYHQAGDSPFIMMGLTPNGLKGKEKLKVIILAGLPRAVEDDLTLVQLYEEIVKLAGNRNLLEELAELNSYYDILNLFIIEHQLFE